MSKRGVNAPPPPPQNKNQKTIPNKVENIPTSLYTPHPPRLPWNEDQDPSVEPPMPKTDSVPILWLLNFAIDRGYVNGESVASEVAHASNEVAPALGEVADDPYDFSQPQTPSQPGSQSSQPGSQSSQPGSQSSYASARSDASTQSFYSSRSTKSAVIDDPEEASPPLEKDPLSLPKIEYREMTKRDNSFKYSGSYNSTERRRHGWGKMTWNISDTGGWIDGDRYHGYWSNGVMEGLGILVEYNEEMLYIGTYVGMHHAGNRTIGTYFWADGTVYEGEWDKNDNMNGTGTMWSPTESGYDVYVGNYENRDIQGKGTYYWANGDTFEGTWKSNSRVKGVMRYKGSNYIYYGDWGTPDVGSGGLDDKIIVCEVYRLYVDDGTLELKGTLSGWEGIHSYTAGGIVYEYDIYTMIHENETRRVYIDVNGEYNEIKSSGHQQHPMDESSEYDSQRSSASSYGSEADIITITWRRRHPRRMNRGGIRPGAEGGGTRRNRGKSKKKGKGTHKKKQKGTRKSKGKGKQKGTRKSKHIHKQKTIKN